MVAAIELGVLFEYRVVTRLQPLPDFVIARGNFSPSAHIAASAMIGAAVRNCFFNGAANALEIVRKIARVQVRLHGHHSATNVHSDGRWNNRALRGNDAANSSADAP